MANLNDIALDDEHYDLLQEPCQDTLDDIAASAPAPVAVNHALCCLEGRSKNLIQERYEAARAAHRRLALKLCGVEVSP